MKEVVYHIQEVNLFQNRGDESRYACTMGLLQDLNSRMQS